MGHDSSGGGEISKMKKKIPKFKTEVEERKFWQQNDSSEYIDWADAEEVVLPRLKPSTRKISIRLPESMIEELKIFANKRDVPYQSLLKIFLSSELILKYTNNIESSRTTQFTGCKRPRLFLLTWFFNTFGLCIICASLLHAVIASIMNSNIYWRRLSNEYEQKSGKRVLLYNENIDDGERC